MRTSMKSRERLTSPTVVYEGRYADSKVFYGKNLLDDSSLYRGCYVAVIVRYSSQPATIRTVYFPFNIEASLGNLLYLDPAAGRGEESVTFELDGFPLISDYDKRPTSFTCGRSQDRGRP